LVGTPVGSAEIRAVWFVSREDFSTTRGATEIGRPFQLPKTALQRRHWRMRSDERRRCLFRSCPGRELLRDRGSHGRAPSTAHNQLGDEGGPASSYALRRASLTVRQGSTQFAPLLTSRLVRWSLPVPTFSSFSARALAMPSFIMPQRPLGSARVTAMPASMGLLRTFFHSSGVKLLLLAIASSFAVSWLGWYVIPWQSRRVVHVGNRSADSQLRRRRG
jgi:hypothetical protein